MKFKLNKIINLNYISDNDPFRRIEIFKMRTKTLYSKRRNWI